ncbi:MAG: phytanoyl-CoA dioxygenase family protein [Caldilineaceae bacterium]|nr:phytanoyl-CoA dioxygenase family protein [Caldilineaceae bacterium]
MIATTLSHFSEQQHQQFMEEGYLRLGRLLDADDLAALQQRIDAIMLGKLPYPAMHFQLDGTTGEYKNLPPDSPGHKGATLHYRRITGLEEDPLFLAYIQHPLVRALTQRYIGEEVSIFRAMFMNKPAHHGTILPWHQDIGEGWGLDRNPIITIWTALDDATVANGCMQIVPGSHQLGVLNPQHFVTATDQARYTQEQDVIDLEVAAGEAVLLHNFLLHRSGVNQTATPRRAFSVAYMDAATCDRATGTTFPQVFGSEQ